MMGDSLHLQGSESELRKIVDVDSGVMSYLFRFWQGTYPLLLIEVQSKFNPVDEVSSRG